MKKYILLALIGAMVLPMVSRAETGSDSVRSLLAPADKLQRADYAGAIKIKLEDGKLVTEREQGKVESTRVFQSAQRPMMVEQFRAAQKQDGGESKIKTYLNTVTPRFGGLIAKLERLTQRVEAHLAKLAEEGKDTSVANNQLKIATNAIASAKAAIAALPRQLGTLTENRLTNAADSQTMRTTIQKVVELVKIANTETQTLIKLVRAL